MNVACISRTACLLAIFFVVHVGQTKADADDAMTRGDVLIVLGSPGTDEYRTTFQDWALNWTIAAETGRCQTDIVDGASEDPVPLQLIEQRITNLVQESDLPLWIVLIGHGTFDGKSANFNIAGPDLRSTDLKKWLAPARRPVAIISCFSASGAFLDDLSAANRVVITSTKGGQEVNFSRFGKFLSEAIKEGVADIDKDRQVSLLEAFLFASKQVDGFYESRGQLVTEHALLDGNGDQLGTRSDAFQGTRVAAKARNSGVLLDGLKAHQWHLVPNDDDLSLPPEIVQKRNELELQLEDLRSRKIDMVEDDYYAQLEVILLQLARLLPEEVSDE